MIWHHRPVTIELRPFEPDEFKRYFRVADMAFGGVFNEADIPVVERIAERERSIAAFEDGVMVGTAGAFSFGMTLPRGGELPVAGVTVVTVLPSHRRRGILTRMMRHQLDDVRRRGESVAILWASEGNIYQRFGYGLATVVGHFEIERSRTAYRRPVDASGRIRLVEADEARRILPPVYDEFRRTSPGALTRSAEWWESEVLYDPEHRRRGASPLFHAVHEADGEPRGYALYRIDSAWEPPGPKSTLRVREALGTTTEATADVWRYLFDVDLVAKIEASMLAADHPLLLLLAEPRRLQFTLGDGVWLRIVDVAKALEPRGYAADGALVLELTDEFCPWNAGRWRLETDGRAAHVSRTDQPPDMALDTTDLAAAYLGSFSFYDLASAGRARELQPGAIETGDRLFRTSRAPWSPGMF